MNSDLPLADVLAGWDRLVSGWGLDPGERCGLIGPLGDGPFLDARSYRPEVAEERMRLLVELAPILETAIGNDAKIAEWLRRSNRHLCGRTPIEALSASTEWARWLIRSLGSAA